MSEHKNRDGFKIKYSITAQAGSFLSKDSEPNEFQKEKEAEEQSVEVATEASDNETESA